MIKIFDDFEIGYEQISSRIYGELSNNPVSFSIGEVEMIRRGVGSRILKDEYINFRPGASMLKPGVFVLDDRYIVRKVFDDWFFVFDPKGLIHYKCDQLYGLIKCLNDIYV